MSVTDQISSLGSRFARLRILAAVSILFAACCFSVGKTAAAEVSRALGKVNFPTSCAPAAQSRLDDAVALLHSFQYREAEAAFTGISAHDPHCAMAYWGMAMSYYQQLWGWPNEHAFAKARADIELAEQQPGATSRERAYIEVASLFFEQQPGADRIVIMQAFSEAWAKVHREYPSDIDAGAFYALSLVALAQNGVDDTANRRKAIAILNPLFRAAPQNPGVAHYLIHAADTPELAPLGLEAARRYASIAPDSAHALHMPSHIFVRLGLWRESINSNIASAKAAAEAARKGPEEISYQVHPMDFLNYCYLQAGDEAAARRVTEDLKDVIGASPEQIANYRADFLARIALETHHWSDAESLVAADQPRSEENTYFVRTIGASRNHHAEAAQRDLEKLEQLAAGLEEENSEVNTQLEEARAWVAFAQGRAVIAIHLLRVAANNEKLTTLSMPAREMLADMLLESGHAAESLREYELSLDEAPNRFDSLFGAARAARPAGHPEEARKFYSQLIAVSLATADRPELREARVFLGSNPGSN